MSEAGSHIGSDLCMVTSGLVAALDRGLWAPEGGSPVVEDSTGRSPEVCLLQVLIPT